MVCSKEAYLSLLVFDYLTLCNLQMLVSLLCRVREFYVGVGVEIMIK